MHRNATTTKMPNSRLHTHTSSIFLLSGWFSMELLSQHAHAILGARYVSLSNEVGPFQTFFLEAAWS